MAHAQPGMAALFQVNRRSAEAEHQKLAQAFLGPGKVVGRIHGAEYVVGRDAPVKRSHQPPKALVADERINFLIVCHKR